MTSKFTSVILIAFALTIASPAPASQKEDHPITAALKEYPKGPVTATLTEKQVRALVLFVIPSAAKSATRAFMVHAVQYQSGKLTALNQNWYVMDFNKTSPLRQSGLPPDENKRQTAEGVRAQ
jgi:hypothetical protein